MKDVVNSVFNGVAKSVMASLHKGDMVGVTGALGPAYRYETSATPGNAGTPGSNAEIRAFRVTFCTPRRGTHPEVAAEVADDEDVPF